MRAVGDCVKKELSEAKILLGGLCKSPTRGPRGGGRCSGRMPDGRSKGRRMLGDRVWNRGPLHRGTLAEQARGKVKVNVTRDHCRTPIAHAEARAEAGAKPEMRSNAPTSAASIAERRPYGRSEAKLRQARRGKEAEEGRTGKEKKRKKEDEFIATSTHEVTTLSPTPQLPFTTFPPTPQLYFTFFYVRLFYDVCLFPPLLYRLFSLVFSEGLCLGG